MDGTDLTDCTRLAADSTSTSVEAGQQTGISPGGVLE